MIKILAVQDPAVIAYTDSKFQILDTFREITNNDIEFNLIPWVNYYDLYRNALISNEYDIVMVAGHLWLKELIEEKLIVPISIDENILSNIVPEILDECMDENVMYLTPSFCDGHIVVTQERLNVSSLNVNDLNQYAQNKQVVLKAHKSEIALDFLPYLRYFQGELIDSFGHRAYSEIQYQNALELYIKTLESNPESKMYGNSEVKAQLLNNKNGVTWSGQLGYIQKDLEPGKTLYYTNLENAWYATWGFSIVANTKNYEECLKFLEYLLQDEVDKIIGKFSGNPVLAKTYEMDEPMYTDVLKMLKTAKRLPAHRMVGFALNELTNKLENDLIKFGV